MTRARMTKALCLALAGTMVLSLSACGKKGDNPAPTDGPNQSVTDAPEAPSGYVENDPDLTQYRPEELVMAGEDSSTVIATMDEQAYWNGAGFNAVLASSALLTDSSEQADAQGLPLARFWDRIGKACVGGKEYEITDLARGRSDGFAVLEMLAADFGVDRYDLAENSVECLGKGLTGDALREAYSDRKDVDDYTVCTYYLHAEMSSLPEDVQAKCRAYYEEQNGADHDERLDGTLAVLLYYSTSGEDVHYSVFFSAPEYFSSYEDYVQNAGTGVRHDITNCCLMVDDRPVGLVNNVMLICNQDVVPDHTVQAAPVSADENGSEGRIEEGDGGLADGSVELEDGEDEE